MAQEGTRYQESRDIWSDYNARQEFEHELIETYRYRCSSILASVACKPDNRSFLC
jgi:hypothetical protein